MSCRLIVGILLLATIFAPSCSMAAPSGLNHEQQWVVDTIARDVAEMVLFAAKESGQSDIKLDAITFKTIEESGSTEKFTNELSWNRPDSLQTRTFTLSQYVWDPANYSPWADQLIKKLKLEPSASASDQTDEEMIAKLSRFTNETIANENKRVSAALSKHPLDANMHEQAALLSALFALRENASFFNDKRPWLNNIAAHLAMAKALRAGGNYGQVGQLAETTLLSICGRQADAMEKAEAILKGGGSDALRSWARSIKISTTDDFRLADLKKAESLERSQYAKAITESLGSDAFIDYLEKNHPEGPNIDFIRAGARGIPSVESGHTFSEPGPTAEMQDLSQDYQLFKGEPIKSAAQANVELSRRPGRCLIMDSTPTLQAISWDDVAAFHARQFLNSLILKHKFELKMWSVRESAKQFQEECDASFGQIRLYPLCKLAMSSLAEGKADKTLAEPLNRIMKEHPEDLNSEMWVWAADLKLLPSPYENWFVPRLPFGTTYDIRFRSSFDGKSAFSLAQLEDLSKLAPHNVFLLYDLCWAKYGDNPTGDQYESILAPFCEYRIMCLNDIAGANRKDPEKYVRSLERVAKFNPDAYFTIGDCYAEIPQPEKAAKAYELAIEHNRDAVKMSNSCYWLVNYYFDHNQKDKALSLAKEAAAVYSNGGLNTLAKLYERMGQLKDAEELFESLNERYDQPTRLCAFYMRNEKANPKYKELAQSMRKKYFPNGMNKIEQTDLAGAPISGAKIRRSSDDAENWGLHKNDIVVAVDGYKVSNVAQFFITRDLSPTDKTSLTVWDGKKYNTISAIAPNGRLGISIVDFPDAKETK